MLTADHVARDQSSHAAAAHSRSGRGYAVVQVETVLQGRAGTIRLHV